MFNAAIASSKAGIATAKSASTSFFCFCTKSASFCATKVSAQKEKELIYNGNNNYHSGKNIQAINQYREALKVSPGFKKANFNLGDAIYKEALGIKNSKSKEPIMGMKPDSLANLMLDEAASQFDVVSQTVSNKDTLHKALHNMGNCRLKQQNYQGAVDAYKKSLKVDCKDEETRYNLAYALKKLKEQKKKDKNKDKDQQKQNPQDQQPQMSKEQVEKLVADVIAATGAKTVKDMGTVMKECQARSGGLADGKMMSEIIKAKLA